MGTKRRGVMIGAAGALLTLISFAMTWVHWVWDVFGMYADYRGYNALIPVEDPILGELTLYRYLLVTLGAALVVGVGMLILRFLDLDRPAAVAVAGGSIVVALIGVVPLARLPGDLDTWTPLPDLMAGFWVAGIGVLGMVIGSSVALFGALQDSETSRAIQPMASADW